MSKDLYDEIADLMYSIDYDLEKYFTDGRLEDRVYKEAQLEIIERLAEILARYE